MRQISQNLQSIYRNCRAIPLILSVAVVIDYALTFYLAGSIERILKYEYSPALVYAIEHDIVIPYLVFTVFFYYAAGYTVLKREWLVPLGALLFITNENISTNRSLPVKTLCITKNGYATHE